MKTLIAVIVATVTLGWLHVFLLDGLQGVAFGLVKEESTHYSQGYSDRQFRRVRLGMSEAEVLSLLGEPLNRYIPGEGEIGWQYSEREGHGDYRLRIIFFQEGKVVMRRSEYYLD